jgi:hypothetical protein
MICALAEAEKSINIVTENKSIIFLKIVSIPENPKIQLGKYRHYKGNEYEVICVAKHSETLEDMVVYCALHTPSTLWVRPLVMFLENIFVDGKKAPRFTFLGK